MIHEKQNAVLQFWFGDDSLKPLQNKDLWFSKNPTLDNEIAKRFGAWVDAAGTGAYNDWVHTAKGALALLILLDQFPRNIFRDDEQAYAYDRCALKIAQIAIAHRLDQQLPVVQRCFVYLPLEHSEDINAQNMSVELFKSLRAEAAIEELNFIDEAIEYAVEHKAIIERFGRFPHRNVLLGRDTTRAERDFLKQDAHAVF